MRVERSVGEAALVALEAFRSRVIVLARELTMHVQASVSFIAESADVEFTEFLLPLLRQIMAVSTVLALLAASFKVKFTDEMKHHLLLSSGFFGWFGSDSTTPSTFPFQLGCLSYLLQLLLDETILGTLGRLASPSTPATPSRCTSHMGMHLLI